MRSPPSCRSVRSSTTRSGSSNGSGLRKMALTTVKMVLVAASASPNAQMAAALTPRSLTRSRRPCRRSVRKDMSFLSRPERA